MSAKSPFDFIKSLNQKDYQEDLKGFVPYITGMVYSMHPEWIKIAEDINLIGSHRLPIRVIYDYYYYGIPKNTKFLGYPKGVKATKNIKYLMEHFKINQEVAQEYLELIDKKDMKAIADIFEKQGIK